jgi:hypothetical protein
MYQYISLTIRVDSDYLEVWSQKLTMKLLIKKTQKI